MPMEYNPKMDPADMTPEMRDSIGIEGTCLWLRDFCERYKSLIQESIKRNGGEQGTYVFCEREFVFFAKDTDKTEEVLDRRREIERKRGAATVAYLHEFIEEVEISGAYPNGAEVPA